MPIRLSKIAIEKFRAIRTAEIEVGDQVALVGQNGSGKSSVLRALNAFFNFESERLAFENGQHSFYPTAFAKIDLTFEDVPPSVALAHTSKGSRQLRVRLRYRKLAIWEIWSGGEWRSVAAETLHRELAKVIIFAYVPTRRDHEVAGWGVDGLLESVVQQAVSTSRQRDNLSPKIKDLGDRLQVRSLDSLAKKLRERTPIGGEFGYQFDRSTPLDYRVLFSGLEMRIRDGDQILSLADAGSGNQSLAVFALYSYLAEQRNSTYILGFEEPEQNLHPQAQSQLVKALRGSGLQVLFTTHSPTLIDALEHEQVVLCRRRTGGTRDPETDITQLPSNFFASTGLDRGAYYRFHRRRNSDFFFADHVLVFESPIDAAVVDQLASDDGVDLEANGVSSMSLDSVTSLPYMFHLLGRLSIPATFFIDRDYFLEYKHGSLSASRNVNGYPLYRPGLRSTVADSLFPRKADFDLFSTLIYTDYGRAAGMLRSVGFYCFQWMLEIDLVRAATPRTRLFKSCKVPVARRTENELLVNWSGAIKKQPALIDAITGVATNQLPRSYQAIRTHLRALVR